MDKDEFMHRIRQERAGLDEALSRIQDEKMADPGPGSWSAKDQLAHLAMWHRVALARVTGGDEDALVGWTAEESASKDIDQVNERILELSRDLSVDDARQEFTSSYDQLLDALDGLDDGDLDRLWLGGHPERGTFAQMIAANTFEHYEEHIPALNALGEK